MLVRFPCPPTNVREPARDNPLAPPLAGEPGREPPIDCLLRLFTILLTDEPPEGRALRARRGPRGRELSPVGVVGDGDGAVDGFVGEGLRELP